MISEAASASSPRRWECRLLACCSAGLFVAHFTSVTLANGVSLDFDRYDHVDEHHYAFQLGEEEFKAAFSRIRNQGITHYADPACREPGQTYTASGRCGTYFRDPDGHLMEILTPVPPAPM
jgi:catechol 2,3-dioxygenase-like lactoylglutathione lyase family enzyme